MGHSKNNFRTRYKTDFKTVKISNSRLIKEVKYNNIKKTLLIKEKKYCKVPNALIMKWALSTSPDHFFTTRIKDKFACKD
jgi:hypothetical protein